jgi:prolyl 4-hydroxylase
MKKEKFKIDSFIGGWYIDPTICDKLVNYFENNKHRWIKGYVGKNAELKKNVKDSTEIPLNAGDTLLDDYNKSLQTCLQEYGKIYSEINTNFSSFSSNIENYNIQKYEPNQGYHKLHCERDYANSRCLVFMTYLNTVKDGGTIFKYQNITTKAKKGLTLIWPTDFTHMHKGQITNETKYIITGWFNFI